MTTCSKFRNPPKGGKTLLLFLRIDLQKIQELGKKFSWEKPNICPSCKSVRLWGHGYVLRYFYGYVFGIWMKRWRCPDCGAVHTVRPCEFPVGFQYPNKIINRSLLIKLEGHPFVLDIPRQNQQYWMRALKFQCSQLENWLCPLEYFKTFILNGQKQITFRLKYRKIYHTSDPPYLPFAVTTG